MEIMDFYGVSALVMYNTEISVMSSSMCNTEINPSFLPQHKDWIILPWN